MFDYIMSVGKTPQITKDLILSTFSLNMNNIASTAFITGTNSTATYGLITTTGVLNDLINENNTGADICYTISETTTGGSPHVQYDIVLDFGREIFFKNIYISFDGTLSADIDYTKVFWDYSQDGRTYINVGSTAQLEPPTIPKTEVNFSYIRARFIKFRFYSYVITVPSSAVINLYVIRAINDYIQELNK